MHRSLFFLIPIVFITFTLIGCTLTTIDTYKPKTPDEAEIIQVIKIFSNTAQNMDKSGHLAVIHDNASIQVSSEAGHTSMLSKSEYAKRLPGLVKWGRDTDVTSIKEIIVSGNTATINGTHIANSRWRAPLILIMVKENDTWSLMKLTYGSYR